MALVWARPLTQAAPRPAAAKMPAARQQPRAARGAPTPVAAIELHGADTPAASAEPILESDSADPFGQAGSVVATSFDKAVRGKAISVALAERQALEDTQKFVKSARGLTKHEQFAAAVEDATVPYCLGKDSLKHNPPVVKVGRVNIGLSGVLVLPYFVKAVATGKCRVK